MTDDFELVKLYDKEGNFKSYGMRDDTNKIQEISKEELEQLFREADEAEPVSDKEFEVPEISAEVQNDLSEFIRKATEPKPARPEPVRPGASDLFGFKIIIPDRGTAETGTELKPDFHNQLLEAINNKHIKKNHDVYNKVHIDRRLFSAILCKKDYQPKKNTAIVLALALELNLHEAEELLNSAGYTLSDSSKEDLIVKYCIERKIWDIDKVDELLYSNTEKTLINYGKEIKAQ